MKDLIEIRWHARGGQGAKTASLLFAEALLSLGKYVQAFPEYGPERTGAPMKSFNRISSKPIRNYSAILSPDVVVVLDPTLLKNQEINSGLNEDTIFIINTEKTEEEIKKDLNIHSGIITVPASEIAKKYLGKNIPNTVMLGALFKVLNLDLEKLKKGLRERLEFKFKSKPEFIKSNLMAIKKAYELSKK